MHIIQNHIYSALNSILDLENSTKMRGTSIKDITVSYCLPGSIIEKKWEKKTAA